MWQLRRIADPAIAKVQPGRFLGCLLRCIQFRRVERTMAMVLGTLPSWTEKVKMHTVSYYLLFWPLLCVCALLPDSWTKFSSSTAQHSRLHMFGYSVFVLLRYCWFWAFHTLCYRWTAQDVQLMDLGSLTLHNPASASYSELQKASPTNGCSMVALAHHINLEISTWPSLSSHRSFSQEVSRCLKLVRSLMNPYGKPCVISLIVFSLLLC